MKDRLKLWIWAAIVLGAIIIDKNPALQEVAMQVWEGINNILGDNITDFLKKNSETIATVLWTYYLTRQWTKKISRNRREKLLKLEHGKRFTVMSLDIRDGRVYPENQMEDHISNVFDKYNEIEEIILEQAKQLDYCDGCIIIPFEENIWKQVYGKMRDNPKIFPEDKLERVAYYDHWLERKETKFIAVLTKTPRYKTMDDGSVAIVDEKEKNPDTAEKLRLITVRSEILEQVLDWCDDQERENNDVCNTNILDTICRDEWWNDPCVDRFIRDILHENYKLVDNPDTPANELLRVPEHRKFMVAIAQMARHVKGWGWKLKVYKEIITPVKKEWFRAPTIKERLANQQAHKVIRRDFSDVAQSKVIH